MKIRQGFVSNSSSSSFVVAFPREPKSVEDVKEMLFDSEQKMFANPYAEYQHLVERGAVKGWPVEQIALTVWNDIQDQKSNDKKAMRESVNNGWFEDFEDLPGCYDDWKETMKLDWSKPSDREQIDELYAFANKENKKRAKKIIERLLEKNPNASFYVFEYSDNDGDYFCAMEHGDVFEKLDGIRTSYH